MNTFDNLKIAVAGTGYVGLSMATLLSQNHQVTAVYVIPEKVEKINNRDRTGDRSLSRVVPVVVNQQSVINNQSSIHYGNNKNKYRRRTHH